jgi:hypothetical protein
MTHNNMDSTWRIQCMSVANREVHPAKFLAKGETDISILPKMANRRFELILGSVDYCSISAIRK